ncbi:MAG: hypothetical protein K0R62_7247 [Nonomuraea muscovyensis]|nr:hypothetical protein [Nonomuraea muscovyensis]
MRPHLVSVSEDRLRWKRYISSTQNLVLHTSPSVRSFILTMIRMTLRKCGTWWEPITSAYVFAWMSPMSTASVIRAHGLTGPLRHLRDHDWHSLTIAAGSFPGPEFFDGRPRERVLSIPRKEAALWTHVCRRWPGLGYGDYGVDHPGPPSDGLRPDPNLRYTSAGDWRFHRQPKDVKGGHGSFHRLCRSLLKSGDWPLEGPAFSWGDQQIALAACEAIGPGSGTQWKAYSMSHHFAVIVAVLDRLLPGTASAVDVR